MRSAEGGQGGMRRRSRGATSLGCWRIKWVDWSRRKETPRAACLVDRSMLVTCEVTTNNVKPFAHCQLLELGGFPSDHHDGSNRD